MSVRLTRPFRAAVASVRSKLGGVPSQRTLFDLIVAAGSLAYRLPDEDVKLLDVTGRKDPRLRLTREFAPKHGGRPRIPPGGWGDARRRLTRVLSREMKAHGAGKLRPLGVLLAYAPGALAPDCIVPTERLLRAAWKTTVDVTARVFPTRVQPLRRLACVQRGVLARLRREAAAGLRIGRKASGQRPGPDGRNLAVDAKLRALVGKAVGKDLVPAYSAKYLFYTRPGDHIWPHSDDPKYPVTLLICVDRKRPRGARGGAAFLAYRPDGRVERYEMRPGDGIAFDAGLVHAREPMRAGERVALLSILYCKRSG